MKQRIKTLKRQSGGGKGLPRTGPRILLCFLPLILLFSALMGRAMQLQLLPHPQLERFMRRTMPSTMTLAQTNRGIIFDRNGRELAVNISLKSVYIDPLLFKENRNWRRNLIRVSQLTRLPLSTLKQKLEQASRFFWVQRHIDDKLAQQLHDLKIPGINFIDESKRSYPNGALASDLLGFTNLDGEGIEGLEYVYDKLLTGQQGTLIGQRDAKGRKLLVGGIGKRGHSGQNITTTIDSVLQYIVERELDRALQETRATGALSIVMDPNSGEILALADRPYFDPNRYQDYPQATWRNRAVTDVFEPGSTFKSFVVAYALDHGIISMKDRFWCKEKSLVIQKKMIREAHEFEWLSTPEVLKYSSNIGSAKIAMLVGSESMRDMMREFGFGLRTDAGLTGETAGLIQPSARWTELDLATAGFGQGIGVTAMQVMRGYAALINGGYLLRPYVALRAEDTQEGTVTNLGIRRVLGQPLTTETANAVRDLLAGVVEEEGTGTRAALANYSVGGKTGTAQRFDTRTASYNDTDYNSSFIGYFPVNNPRLLIMVIVDQPRGLLNSGGMVAAPVFKRIAEQAAVYMNVEPDRAEPEPVTIADRRSAKALKLAATEGLRGTEAMEEAAKNFDGSLNMEFKGSLKGLTVREVVTLAQKRGFEVVVQGSGFATGKISRDRKQPNLLYVQFEHGTKGKT